jgi:hypothetical protein
VKILATLCNQTHVAALLDVETGHYDLITARPEFVDDQTDEVMRVRPFGITWDEHTLYIANNRQLLKYDRKFNFLGIERISLQGNTHQLAIRENCVWAVSPRTRSIIGVFTDGTDPIEFDVFRQEIIPYLERQSSEADDIKHINSLLWADGCLYVTAHNFGPSFIMIFDAETFRIKTILRDVGESIHGVALHNGELFWIDTNGHVIRSSHGRAIYLGAPGFGRGLAVTDNHFIVGVSQMGSREVRMHGNASVRVINRSSFAIEAQHELVNSGNVNDLRLLDRFDHAHLVQPFLSAS